MVAGMSSSLGWAGRGRGEGWDEWLPACQAALSRRQLEPAKLADDEMPFAALMCT